MSDVVPGTPADTGTPDALPDRATVVVVGAGIIGASVTDRLSRHGVDVVLLEQSTTAGGATGQSGGMVRAFDQDPAISALATAALRQYSAPEEWPDGPIPLRRVGAVTVAAPEEVSALREAARRLRAEHDEAVELVSDVPEVQGVLLNGGVALVEPAAGWVDPTAVTTSWIARARRRGARYVHGARVERVRSRDSRTVLHTTVGSVTADAVVFAVGAWGTRPPAGIAPAVGVRTRAVQVSLVRGVGPHPHHSTFVDLRTGGYARPIDDRTSLIGAPLLRWDEDPDGAQAPDTRHHAHTVEVVAKNLPWVAAAEQVATVRAMDGYCDTHRVLLPTDLGTVWFTRGWNGGGVRVAPEVGRLVVDELRREGVLSAAR